MASIIIADDTKFYDGSYLETQPIGGTESSIIRFARAMVRRGHNVSVYTNCAVPISDGGVDWIPLSHPRPETCDVYVACQHPRLFGLVPRPQRLVGWMLWQPNEWVHYKKFLKVWWHRPIPLFTSLHQVRIYSRLLPGRVPHIVIPLGLPEDIRGLAPLRTPPGPQAIFASNPQRNLNALVQIWCQHILPRCPNAVLNVYGITELAPGDDAWKMWEGTLLPVGISQTEKMSVRIHATASRAELNKALRGARVMLYLGHKVEAFCLAAAEAQALGVPAVVAPLTVLPERVEDGVTGFVRDNPIEFANAAVALLSDDVLWRSQHEAALKLKRGISWDEFAARFECAILSDRIGTNRSWNESVV